MGEPFYTAILTGEGWVGALDEPSAINTCLGCAVCGGRPTNFGANIGNRESFLHSSAHGEVDEAKQQMVARIVMGGAIHTDKSEQYCSG